MFDIEFNADGNVEIRGRLDAANAESALLFLNEVGGACVIDMGQLDYISSAGLGVLLRTHKRLMGEGGGIRLVKVSPHINDIFTYSGFDKLFDIEAQDSG